MTQNQYAAVWKMSEKSLCLLARFDRETQERLAGYYGILRQNGFTGRQTKGIPYHITLGNKDTGSEEQLLDGLGSVCGDTACFEIHLSHIGLFGMGVLFIAPDMNFELLALRRRFFPDCGYGAYDWTAHATLLMDEPQNILKAFPIAAENFKPFIARIEGVALYEFYPIRFIRDFPLNNAPQA